MSDTITQVLVQSVREWVNEHPNVSVKSDGINPVFAKDLVDDSLMNDSGKDYYESKRDKISYYQGVSYLLSAIQRVDYEFVYSIVGKLRNKLQKLNIDPDNICLNKDVMQELQEIIRINSSEINNEKTSEKDSLQALREEYEKMIEESSEYNIGTREHHGIHR